ncbi:MAG TPA: UbiA-like polyprenyltransferase [Pirellulales bacterium]
MTGVGKTIRSLLEMIRFSHTLFALPFALLAAVLAWRLGLASDPPRAIRGVDLLGIVLCMVFARSAAMAFNRLLDRDIDAENPRTKDRHIPAGKLSVAAVTTFAALTSVGFLLSTTLFWPNWLPLALAAPVLACLMFYSWTKRFTSLAHFWLGLSLSLAPIAAWIAIRGDVALAQPDDLIAPFILALGVFCWVAGFDLIYACQDADFDRARGLFSLPAKIGVVNSLRVSAGCHACTVIALAFLPTFYPLLGTPWWIGVAIAAVLLIYEHLIVKADDLRRVNEAFFYVNSYISVGLLIVGLIDWWVQGR